MRLELPLAALLFSLSAVSARALEVGKASPDEFLDRSRAEPGRLHALVIGATWCHACKLLAAGLESHDASSATAVGRAAWDEVESDLYGTAKLSSFLSRLQAPGTTSLPAVLVLRGGEALGMSFAGNSLPKLEAFLAEAEGQPARSVRKPVNSSMLCPGKSDWASYTLGISGYMSKDDASTDDFGRKVLLSFTGSKASQRTRLFAPPRSAAAVPGTESARAEDGVFFTAEDPVARRASLLEDVSRSTYALAALSSARGRELRLVLTGHSGENGMTIGYRTSRWFKDDPTATFDEDVQLSRDEVAAAVRAAARAGKTVRGLVTTCYAGRYADAFMPEAGVPAAPTCAAFATLPDKPADGCYSNGAALGVDYASKLLAHRACGDSEDGRDLHYAVAATTSGRDVPMLSSEYFLLYGPGAEFLGRGDRAPAPPRSVQRYELPDGIRVYADVISNQVLRAYQGDKPIDPPRLALLDCVGDDYTHSKLDRQNLSSFYLRPHHEGAFVAQCTPYVKLYWESDGASPRPSTGVFLDPSWGGWLPADDYEGFRKDFGTAGPTITLEGMRPAARVLLTTVIPAFSDAGAADLGGRLERIAEELQPLDAPLAAALQTLLKAQAGGVARLPAAKATMEKSVDRLDGIAVRHVLRPAPPGGAAGVADRFPAIGGLEDAPAAADVESESVSVALEAISSGLESSHPHPQPVDADALIAAMLDTLSPSRYDYGSELPRLVHVAAAAQAELSLFEEAKTSPEARHLVSQLEAIKTCEQGLY